MATINPQFITDVNGEKLSVVLPIDEFEAIMEELDELEDIKLYDEAKRDDDGERILLSDYLKSRQKLHV
jgi:PHD/YefM family antitoxin component YafN of YafNO toxin-antitoxin module